MEEKKYLKQMAIFTDATRLKIIYILSLNKFCSMHIEKLLNVSQPNISRHIEKMLNADVVICEKRGRRNIYELNPEFIQMHSQIIEQLQDLYIDLLDKEKFAQYILECKRLK